MSTDRYAYGIVTLALIFGYQLSRYPGWGYPVLCWFSFMLLSFSVRFAQHIWIA
jgi:hypothetical protein